VRDNHLVSSPGLVHRIMRLGCIVLLEGARVSRSQSGIRGGYMSHFETHRVHRIGWLRASVLGANDGIVSTASLVIGVASAGAGHADLMTAGLAGLVAGAMSMAAGEYVSVSSQADTEQSDLQREREELETDAGNELNELTEIYVLRGLEHSLARQVAVQLTAHDALGAHARDELGITQELKARPIQAALASALTFAVGASLPLATAAWVPSAAVIVWVSATSLVSLVLLGGFGAHAGGARIGPAALRVTFWGALAMGVTAAIGAAFGTVV
jgi:vacuolar iron transporter family protein